MKKRKRSLRKPLMLLCSAVALVAISVGATLAYLTDTEAVANTFTVGRVGISLSETDVDNDGDMAKNAYHLVPGQTYTKDPTVTMDANSEPAYVRMLVKVSGCSDLYMVFLNNPGSPYYQKIAQDTLLWDFLKSFINWDSKGKWESYSVFVDLDDDSIKYEFRYNEVTEKSGSARSLPSLFTTLTVPGFMTNEDLKVLADADLKFVAQEYPTTAKVAANETETAFAIEVTAHAIQAAGFKNANEAWTAFDNPGGASTEDGDNSEFEADTENEADKVLGN